MACPRWRTPLCSRLPARSSEPPQACLAAGACVLLFGQAVCGGEMHTACLLHTNATEAETGSASSSSPPSTTMFTHLRYYTNAPSRGKSDATVPGPGGQYINDWLWRRDPHGCAFAASPPPRRQHLADAPLLAGLAHRLLPLLALQLAWHRPLRRGHVPRVDGCAEPLRVL